MEDRKWFLVAQLQSFSIFDWTKFPKWCFLTKITTLSRHSFEQWAWQVLDFTSTTTFMSFTGKELQRKKKVFSFSITTTQLHIVLKKYLNI